MNGTVSSCVISQILQGLDMFMSIFQSHAVYVLSQLLIPGGAEPTDTFQI